MGLAGGWRGRGDATLRSRSPRWLYPVLEVPRRLHRVLSPLSPAGPVGPIARKSGTGMPVVGMVGGGQLARMTAAAAVGLGVTFRVLSESESESAALVTRDVTVGSHLSLPDIAAFAAECDVITFDHEHVPGPILAELESAGTLVRPGGGALRYTQDKLAMRHALRRLVSRVPGSRPFPPSRTSRRSPEGGCRSCSRRSAAATTARASGSARPPRRSRMSWRTASRCSPRSSYRSGGSSRRWSPGRRPGRARPTRWCRPCRSTASAGR